MNGEHNIIPEIRKFQFSGEIYDYSSNARQGNDHTPCKLRSKYKLQEGEVFTIIDLGGGSFLLKPRIYEIDKISTKTEKILREDGVTLEELFETLRELRK